MKKSFAYVAALLLVAGSALAETPTARVMGQRVNLRARADLNAEVVGQVSDGDQLKVKSVQDAWVEVVPPDSVDLWVNKDLVSGTRVTVNQANVRAGPGVNYTVVGRLNRDDVVAAKGAFGEWLRIAPFAAASLWVSRDLVDVPPAAAPAALPPPTTIAEAGAPAPGPVVAPAAAPAVATNTVTMDVDPAEPVPTHRAAPTDLKLIPFDGQGRVVEHEGVLRTSGYLLGSPGDFRLVQPNPRGAETLAYLRGNRDQLRGLLGRRLRITGPEYWVERQGDPVVVVEKIQLLEAIPAP